MVIHGLPPGTMISHFPSPRMDEVRRLYCFGADLEQAGQWLLEIARLPKESHSREALAIASLVRFCSCFESTAGHRQKPLKTKRIFDPKDRLLFRDLKQIRDKTVVHDEQLYPNHVPWLATDHDCKAVEVGVLAAHFGFADRLILEDLARLVRIARDWVFENFEKAAVDVVQSVNGLSRSEVERLIRDGTPFTIRIDAKSDA